jgi:hypothetical protein
MPALVSDAAISEMERGRAEGIRAQLHCANYDFSSFSRIIALVCRPFVLYSDSAETSAYIDGTVRACVSAEELGDCLRGATDAMLRA